MKRTIQIAESAASAHHSLLLLTQNLNESSMTKKDIKALMADQGTRSALVDFFEDMLSYQRSNNKAGLASSYDKLPDSFKAAIYPSKKRLNSLFRGDDGKSEETAISWTSKKHIAKLFGYFVYPFAAVLSFNGAIDTPKLFSLVKSTELEDWGIGDDEDEVILLNVKWKSNESHDDAI